MDYPAATVSYNAEGKPFWPAYFLRFYPRNKATNAKTNFYFSSLRRTETITVIDPATKSDVARSYIAGGSIVNVPPIKRSQALTIDQHQVVLSMVHSDVKNMVYGYNMIRALFELHIGQLSVDTGKLIAQPVCELYGFVDSVNDKTEGLDENNKMISTATLSLVPHHAELEYSNNILRSLEEGMKRSGDEIFWYVDSVGDWNIPWGKESHKHNNRGGGGNGGGGGKGGGSPVPKSGYTDR
jgi:hypothetical protein